MRRCRTRTPPSRNRAEQPPGGHPGALAHGDSLRATCRSQQFRRSVTRESTSRANHVSGKSDVQHQFQRARIQLPVQHAQEQHRGVRVNRDCALAPLLPRRRKRHARQRTLRRPRWTRRHCGLHASQLPLTPTADSTRHTRTRRPRFTGRRRQLPLRLRCPESRTPTHLGDARTRGQHPASRRRCRRPPGNEGRRYRTELTHALPQPVPLTRYWHGNGA